MAESSDNESEPGPTEADGTSERERSDADTHLPSAWRHVLPLGWALLASTILHVGTLLLAQTFAGASVDLSADVQWLEGADRMTGFGMETKSVAKLEPKPKSTDDTPDDEETERKLEKALKGDDSSEEPDRENSPEASTDDTSTPPEPNARDDAPPANPETEDDPGPEKPASQPEPFADVADHEALDRTGPNDLPDMRSFAPGNAQLSALIRVDRIRDQPYEDVLRHILRSLPDYRLLLGMPSFDPIRDMDWFFMASPNPRYIQHTFLAVRHNLSVDAVRQLLDRRYPESPPWSSFREFPMRDLVPENPHYRDPRKILLTREGLALVAKERLLPEVVGPLARDSDLFRPAGEARGSNDSTARPRPSLLDGLARIHRVARRDDTVLLMSARGMKNVRLPGVGRLPPVETIRMSVKNPDRPDLDIDIKFGGEAGARKFANRCPALRSAIENAVPGSGFCGLSALLDRISCSVDETFVNVHGTLPADSLARLASCASFAIPRPPALDDLPEPPQPRESESSRSATPVEPSSAPREDERDASSGTDANSSPSTREPGTAGTD